MYKASKEMQPIFRGKQKNQDKLPERPSEQKAVCAGSLRSSVTFQPEELRAVEVDHGQQRRAVTHVLQQVVQQGEVLQGPPRQVVSTVTHLHQRRAFLSRCTHTSNQDSRAHTLTQHPSQSIHWLSLKALFGSFCHHQFPCLSV